MQPAHKTKHLRVLASPPFHLAQSDDGLATGTTLWLGAQILAAYLPCHLAPRPHTRPRAIELGSGVGLTALVLSALGYDVLATDTPHVCQSVLKRNITANLPHLPATAGVIQVRELDWTVESDRWLWNDPMRITPSDDAPNTDTLYDASLVHPFFRTVRALAALGHRSKPPVLVLALERRDPQLIEDALACAPVLLTRVSPKKVRKAMARAGMDWDASDWEGVEIWRGTLHTLGQPDTHSVPVR